MAQFFTTINHDAIASGLPADWTQETGTFTAQVVADATTGNITDRILNTSADSVSGDITWNPPGSTTDQEALALVQLTGPLPASTFFTLVNVRHQAGAVSGYYVGLFSAAPTSGTIWEISVLNAGASTPLVTAPLNWLTGQWFWTRLRVAGTTLSAKVWPFGTVEPVGFQLTTTDATWASGKTGARLATIGTNIAVFSAASGTDSAPFPTTTFSQLETCFQRFVRVVGY